MGGTVRESEEHRGLAGRWRRTTPRPEPVASEEIAFWQDAAWYPGEIDFREPDPSTRGLAGAYLGVRDESQRFIAWDAGSWRLGDDGLTLSVANDELVTYAVELHEDELTILDERGLRTTYLRIG